jgi:hypothetical protein
MSARLNSDSIHELELPPWIHQTAIALMPTDAYA